MMKILCILLVFLVVISGVSSHRSKAEWTLEILSGILCKKDYRRIACSVNLKTNYITKGNDRLVFANVIANNGGDYDPATGTFKCRVPGLYKFSWMLHQSDGPSKTHINLMRNNEVKFQMYLKDGKENVACTTYLQLNYMYGDKVWIRTHEKGRTIVAHNYSTFSGMLV